MYSKDNLPQQEQPGKETMPCEDNLTYPDPFPEGKGKKAEDQTLAAFKGSVNDYSSFIPPY